MRDYPRQSSISFEALEGRYMLAADAAVSDPAPVPELLPEVSIPAAIAAAAPVADPVATEMAAPNEAAAALPPVAATTELVSETSENDLVHQQLIGRQTDDGLVTIATLAVSAPSADSVGDHGKAEPVGAVVEAGTPDGSPSNVSIHLNLTVDPPPSAETVTNVKKIYDGARSYIACPANLDGCIC